MSLCSVIIPVHNRAALTDGCLQAILADPPLTPTELIVVDDGSTDRTGAVLEQFGDAVQVVRHEEAAGFASACNAGAAAAAGDHLVFLNNDTLPRTGWLDALVDHARRHSAAVVGSKLLYPNGTVQHAGVAICTDGNPRHMYAGFPSDHPAVCRSRPLAAVTAASMLVRAQAFRKVGGFDTTFHNGLEDTDLCLRLQEDGGSVWLCADSVVIHLESATRGRRPADVERNGRIFRDRWAHRVRPDEFQHYVDDGLISISHGSAYPVSIQVAPELASVAAAGPLDRHAQAGHLLDLLQETIRLTVQAAERELGRRLDGVAAASELPEPQPADLERVAARALALEAEVHELQSAVAEALSGFEASEYLGYRRLVRDLCAVVEDNVEPDATVLVVSRGDDDLLSLGGRRAWHFPQTDEGTYLGHYPADSADAITQLETLVARGADYLVVPSTAWWWLEHYPAFAAHLQSRHGGQVWADSSCVGYALRMAAAVDAPLEPAGVEEGAG